ncbi:hypothetical protein [Paenibacillus sp. MMS18-CY102]|uniref:hypothetical protein n=1 Tax=Paenibacillus sp. MMS18-CY102 TaxID=2682849 RepID=UPI001365DA6C|nr:hypothetical protein [Paenibacillus sp. MMS18-CY102]MWC27866.1 hypothetical protein [Paenibacillus sp. MMS18-CY102]
MGKLSLILVTLVAVPIFMITLFVFLLTLPGEGGGLLSLGDADTAMLTGICLAVEVVLYYLIVRVYLANKRE